MGSAFRSADWSFLSCEQNLEIVKTSPGRLGYSRHNSAAGCGVISLNPLPVIKGIMSRLVNENRQGALFANVYFLEAVCRLAGSSVFFNIYADTQYLMRGFVYLVYSGFFAVGAILMIPLLFSSRRDLRKSKEISVQVWYLYDIDTCITYMYKAHAL